jgi:hypothetical protein
MDHAAKPIAVIRGATGGAIQQLMYDFVERWQSAVRLVGVIENTRDGDALESRRPDCGPGHLCSIADENCYPLFQQLGPGATGCALDPRGVVEACETVRRQIAQGCDLVLLSKFGKMEAESGSGLLAAFVAAVEAGIPIITSVAPKFDEAWTQFAAPLFTMLPAESEAVEAWWEAIRASRSAVTAL